MDAVDGRLQKFESLLKKVLENQEEQKQHLEKEIEIIKFSLSAHEKRIEAIERKTDSLTKPKTVYSSQTELTDSAIDPNRTGEYEETSSDSFIVLSEDSPQQTDQDSLHQTTSKTVYTSHAELTSSAIIAEKTSDWVPDWDKSLQTDRDLLHQTTDETVLVGLTELSDSSINPNRTGECEKTPPGSFIMLPENRSLQADQDLLHQTTPKTVYISDVREDISEAHQTVTETSQASPTILRSHDVLSEQTKSINPLPEEERYFLRDQLGKAQEDIISRLTGLDHGLQTLTQSVTSLMERERDQMERETAEVAHQPRDSGQSQISLANTAQSEHSSGTIEEFRSVCRELETSVLDVTSSEIAWSDREVKDRLSILEGTVNGGMAHLVRLMESVDTRLSEELDKKVLTLKTELRKEIEVAITETSACQKKTEESIQSSTNAICALLEQQSNNTGIDISTALSKTSDKILSQVKKLCSEIKEQSKSIERDMPSEFSKISEQFVGEMNKSCNKIMQNQTTELKSMAGHLAEEIVGKCVMEVKDCQNKIEDNIQSSTTDISTLLQEQKDNIDALMTNRTQEIQINLTKVCHQIKQIKDEGVKSAIDNLTAHNLKCTETVKETIKATGKKLEAKIFRSKMEQFSCIEKECQIIRDRQQPVTSDPARTKYIFDFYVDNFRSLIKSGDDVYSLPWHIDSLKSSIMACAWFPLSEKMELYVLYGRHPREVGLEPRSGVRLKIRTTVTDTSGSIADLPVGQGTTNILNESNILHNGGRGWYIGTVSCQKLKDLGFGRRENYVRGAILLRFQVDVV